MGICLFSIHFFHAVAGDIGGRFEGDIADEAMAFSPGRGEDLGAVESLAGRRDGMPLFVCEVDPVEDRVVVRPAGGFAVFTAMEVADFGYWDFVVGVVPIVFLCWPLVEVSQGLHELLEVGFIQGAIFGEVSIVIGERDEDRQVVELALVHESNSPLSRTFKAAPYALAARNGDGQIAESGRITERNFPFPVLRRARGFEAVERGVARHRSQANAAPHDRGCALDVLPVGSGGGCREELFRG